MPAIMIKGHINGVVNIWSRHSPARPFCHMILTRLAGKALYQALTPAAVLFVSWHPTKTWSALGAQYKYPDGGAMHSFGMGDMLNLPPQAEWPAFSDLETVECYVKGHVKRWASLTSRAKNPFSIIELPAAGGVDESCDAAGLIWKTGDAWSSIPDQYRKAVKDPNNISANTPAFIGLP